MSVYVYPPSRGLIVISQVIIVIVRDQLLFIAGEGGRKILGGITWFLGEQKGESVVTENPKGGDRWKLWKDS